MRKTHIVGKKSQSPNIPWQNAPRNPFCTSETLVSDDSLGKMRQRLRERPRLRSSPHPLRSAPPSSTPPGPPGLRSSTTPLLLVGFVENPRSFLRNAVNIFSELNLQREGEKGSVAKTVVQTCLLHEVNKCLWVSWKIQRHFNQKVKVSRSIATKDRMPHVPRQKVRLHVVEPHTASVAPAELPKGNAS